MKLNYKRTFFVGLAFLSISAFWQLYDGVIPLILKNTFGIGDTVSGVIMALDNIVALVLLPLFGALSDKCKSPLGRRTPFILTGTGCAVVLMIALPLIDNAYFANPSPVYKVVFIGVLALLLLAMGLYRSPAVALMPDVTPKPLRSKGNAVINLMGAVGGILYLLLTTFLYSAARTAGKDHIDYLPLFIIVALIMVTAVVILFFTIKERKLEKEIKEYEHEHPEDNLEVVDASGKTVLPKPVKLSLLFVLLSIFLWFMGYNAITTAFTKYAQVVWNMPLGGASLCLTIAMATAIIAFIPVGIVSSKLGRKRTILSGITLLTICFACAAAYSLASNEFSPVLYVLFGLVGIAWASINVNSLPMVVEMCKGSDIGKFTGYYYFFSMSACIVTPILSGALLEYVGYWTLFPYGALFVALSFVTMLFVKHGDNKPKAVKSLDAYEELDA